MPPKSGIIDDFLKSNVHIFLAGDYVKFNFPMAASTTLLAWGAIDFKAHERDTSSTNFYKNILFHHNFSKTFLKNQQLLTFQECQHHEDTHF